MKQVRNIVLAAAVVICFPHSLHAAWSVETVDENGDVGYHSSLAFDGTGRPCVSYHDATNGELRFACRDGEGSWSTEALFNDDPRFPAGFYSSLAFSKNAQVIHIAYRRGVNVMSVLRYARKVGLNEWEHETLDNQAQGVGHEISMELDWDDHPHIAHLKSWGQATVKYVAWDGAAWQSGTVYNPPSDYYFGDADLALDMDGDPLVAIVATGDNASLDLARLVGNKKWKSASIDPNAKGSSVAFVVDPITGENHVVWATETAWNDPSPTHLYYASKAVDAETWTVPEVVDMAVPDYRFEFLDMAVDGVTGYLHLAYYDSASGSLKYRKNEGGGWGDANAVDTSGLAGLFPSIAVKEGTPHITHYDSTNGRLLYSVQTASISCVDHNDCDDLNQCTSDVCDTTSGTCTYTDLPDATTCSGNSGPPICCSGTCLSPTCLDDGDCDDGESWTDDICVDAGACTAVCENEWDCKADGYCPAGCSADSGAVNYDPDCTTSLPCEGRARKECVADVLCDWDARNKICSAL